MPLATETWQRLKELYGCGLEGGEQAHELLRDISPGDLAAWLRERVAHPSAERYLLGLFHAAADDARACRRFHRELTLHLRPQLQRNVLGWGEISTVTEVAGSPFACWRHPETGAPMRVVYKKMPPFLNRDDAEAFVGRYLEYNTVLRDEAGIAVPHFEARITEPEAGRVLIFVVQERVDPASVGHEILRDIGAEAAERLYAGILREYAKLFRFNQARKSHGYQVGLDGQIPNWAVAGFGGDPDALTGEEPLLYLDTNVPMIRIDGQDVVSTDMYFQALPGAARWLIKRLKIDQEVMDRYFQTRIIMLDFLGNLIVRHRADLVSRMVELSNEALAGPFAAGGFEPFTLEEVQRYYRSDVATWRLWRSLKLLGVLSDGVSAGDWRILRRAPEFYRIWTEPIF
jgi:hypothetical protein